MKQYDLGEWVNLEQNPTHKTLREAIHTILLAISTADALNCKMIIKGGILLAIRYDSVRFTEDIDFSTDVTLSDFDKDLFLSTLEQGLIIAVEKLPYGLDCKIQSHKFMPSNNPDATYPTFKLVIGYAYKHDTNLHKRLLSKKALHVVKIDYSLNEETLYVESLKISGGGIISAYSLTDVIAEKYRAILQQKVRNRVRRQDAYDLFILINKNPIKEYDEKKHILDAMKKKSLSRGLEINSNSIIDPEIIKRSKEEYYQISSEIEGELPDFDTVYDFVRKFYQSLPW